jgi:hypothetical protein
MSCQHKILILNVNRPSRSYLSFFSKVNLLKAVLLLNIYQNTKYHGPTLAGTSSASTSVV